MATDQQQGLARGPQRAFDTDPVQRPYPALPPSLEMERLFRQARMDVTRSLGERAISAVADIHGYASYKTSCTLQMATLLRQVATEGGWLTPEMEHSLAQLALTYLQTTLSIIGVVSEEMIQTVRELSERSASPGLWDTVALWLRTH